MQIAILVAGFLLCIGAPEVPAASGDGPSGSLSSDSASPKVSTRRILNWMGHWKGEGRREQLVHEIHDEFSFMHPELEVRLEFAPDVMPEGRIRQQGAAELILEMIRTGEFRWDVVWLDSIIYAEVAKGLEDWDWGRKYLVDFAMIDGFAETQKSFLMEGPEAHRMTGGICPGPYIEGYYYVVWFNREVADRLGISIRKTRMSAEDLLGYVEAVNAYNEHADEPVEAILDFKYSGSVDRLVNSLLYSAMLDDDGNLDVSGNLSNAVSRTVNYCKTLNGMHPLASPQTIRERSWDEAAHLLMDGRALMFFDATWRYNAFEQVDPAGLQKLRLAEMPAFDDRSLCIGGYMTTWAVFKDAPGAADGIELVRFWSRPVVAEKWVRYTKNPTGLMGNLYDPVFGKDIYAAFQRYLGYKYGGRILSPLVFPMRNGQLGLVESGFRQSKKIFSPSMGDQEAAAENEVTSRSMGIKHAFPTSL